MADPMLRFAHRLAWQTGKLDVEKEVLAVLTRGQLIRWMAFLELEPAAADRDDVRGAFHTAKILNQWITDEDKRYLVSDLLVNWEEKSEPKPPLTDEERELAIQSAILSGYG
jgi:hypothetical protein